jgi:outer membrane protein
LTDTERNLRFQAFLQYYQLVAQHKALEARRLNLSTAIKLLDRNFERYKVGLAIRADVLQAENNVLSQKSRMVEAQRAYLDGLDGLALLLGVQQPINIEPEVDLAPIDLPLDVEADWPEVRQASSSIRDLETQLRNLEIELGFRRSELRPDYSLAVDYTRQGEDTTIGETYRNLDNQSYSLSLNYALPWGKRAGKSRLAQTEEDLAIARARLEEANQQARQRWEGLFRELDSKWVQVDLSQSSVGVAEENFQIQLERNKVGLASTLDVVQAQETLLESQLALINAQVSYQNTYRELLLLAGVI